MAQYKIGTDDPTIVPDAGAGAWNSEPTTTEMQANKAGIIASIAVAYAVIGDDATRHMARKTRRENGRQNQWRPTRDFIYCWSFLSVNNFVIETFD